MKYQIKNNNLKPKSIKPSNTIEQSEITEKVTLTTFLKNIKLSK